jgi:hypothetical protein
MPGHLTRPKSASDKLLARRRSEKEQNPYLEAYELIHDSNDFPRQ